MNSPRLTDKAIKETELRWSLEQEAISILELVVAEWSTDPTSTQCFDLRTVNRAKEVVSSLNKLPRLF